jgi:prevent-host-death family protein
MSWTITIQDAQARLKELIDKLAPGEEVIITDNQQPVAKLVGARSAESKLGTMRGTVLYMAPDFDEPMDELRKSVE